MSSGEDEVLPEIDWVEYFNDSKKKPYYYNLKTKKTQWDIPPDYKLWKENAIAAFLKQIQWRRSTTNDGRVYYYEISTKKTQWEAPTELKDYEKELVALTHRRYAAFKKQAEVTSAATGSSSLAETKASVSSSSAAVQRDSEEEVGTAVAEARRELTHSRIAKRKRDDDEDDLFGDRDDDDAAQQQETLVVASTKKESGNESDRITLQPEQEAEEERRSEAGFDDHSDYDGDERYDDDDWGSTGDGGGSDFAATPTYTGGEGDDDDVYADNYEWSKGGGESSDLSRSVEFTDGASGFLQRSSTGESVITTGTEFTTESSFAISTESLSLEVEDNEEKEREAELARIEEKLTARDAVMDPGVIEAAQRALSLRLMGPEAIVKSLSESYCGYSQMAQIVTEWLALAKSLEPPPAQPLGTSSGSPRPPSTATAPSAAGGMSGRGDAPPPPASISGSAGTGTLSGTVVDEFDPEAAIAEQLASMIKQRFDKNVADSILTKFTTIPSWLSKMMSDSTFRRMLIELYDQNRGSTLLGLSLRQISSLGHHREIAEVIRDIDYFEVFDDLLVDMIVRIDSADSPTALAELLENFTRLCSASEYMFLYANDLLVCAELKMQEEAELEEIDMYTSGASESASAPPLASTEEGSNTDMDVSEKATNGTSSNDHSLEATTSPAAHAASNGLKKRKLTHRMKCGRLRRLRQELENAAIFKKRERTTGSLGGGALFALRLIGSYSLSSLRVSGFSDGDRRDFDRTLVARTAYELTDILQTNEAGHVHLQRLCQYYLSIPADKDNVPLTAKMVQSLAVPLIFLRDPPILSLLVGALVHPTKQVPQNQAWRAARLLALAGADMTKLSAASGYLSVAPSGGGGGEGGTAQYSAACILDERVFTEEELDEFAKQVSLVEKNLLEAREICAEMAKMNVGFISYDQPRKLIILMSTPVVSMAAIRWVETVLADSNITKKNSFLYILPVCLQIAITAAKNHPSQRSDSFHILKAVFKLSASDYDDSGARTHFKASTDSYTVVSAQKDAILCLVHLIGLGFVALPMDFLKKQIVDLDGVLVRHLMHTLLNSFKAPYSTKFSQDLHYIFSSPSARKAADSSFFSREDATLLHQFMSSL